MIIYYTYIEKERGEGEGERESGRYLERERRREGETERGREGETERRRDGERDLADANEARLGSVVERRQVGGATPRVHWCLCLQQQLAGPGVVALGGVVQWRAPELITAG